ncbi:recombinase family protein [Nocardioides luteus]|uniref:recombinase family protein n=1 Tax=Nocardioides luteus TaxID=1844 RepID=UPI0018CA932D|nr:recombinase family protein [Nocardioides luteus]MBG6095951.1 DNA invertase Pin-like site-specific DNA recombinase [Nocardioides luteus]
MNEPNAPRVVLYARISEDVSGDGLKVADQLERCRKHAADRGWDVVAEKTDNDITALKGDDRPGYAEVLRLVRLRKVDHVVVWQTSRLLRNRRERAEAIELFGRQRVGIIAVKGVSFDLSTAYGRGQAGIMGEFDTMESEVKSERILAAATERAEAGRPAGYLGYGWVQHGKGRDATYVEDPEQANIIREIVDRLLAGDTLLAITEDLNSRDVPSPEASMWTRLTTEEQERRLRNGRKPPSKAWGKTSVKKLAIRQSNVAIRVHHRGKKDEAEFDGSWPPLVDKSKHDRVTALLADPKRRVNGLSKDGPIRPGARRHLLSWGIGECGVCGDRLRVAPKQGRYGKRHILYTCDSKGCVGRNEESVDLLVRAVVLDRLSRPDAFDWLRRDDDEVRVLTERAASLRQRLDDAAEDYADGLIDREQMRRITARLQPELEHAEDERRQASTAVGVDVLQPLAEDGAEDRWDAMGITERRAVLETLGLRVRVNRQRRGPGFDPNSIEFIWPTAK